MSTTRDLHALPAVRAASFVLILAGIAIAVVGVAVATGRLGRTPVAR